MHFLQIQPGQFALPSTGEISSGNVVTTIAGTAGVTGSADGVGTAASFNQPISIAIDGSGNIYVTDYGNQTVRKITPTGLVSTLAGAVGVQGDTNGSGTSATFSNPQGLATDAAGNVYVADTGNNEIRKVSPTGVVSTLVGSGPGGGAFTPGSLPGFIGGPYSVAISGRTLITTSGYGLVQVSNLP